MAATRLSATSREPEEYAKATGSARETRQRVATQLCELVVEGDRMGGREEVAQRIQRVIEAERRIAQAAARQVQAAEHGMPQHLHAEAEREGREALRAAAMNLAVSAGTWVAAMDHAAAAPASRPSESAPI